VSFRGPEAEFRRIGLAGCQRTAKSVLKFGIVVGELQQGFAVRAVFADTQQVLRSRVQ